MFDFLIKSGRIIDPTQHIDGIQDIAIRNGRIASIAGTIHDGQAHQVIDATGLVITPGLIDLHTRVYEGVSIYGIDADKHCLGTEVTTVMDVSSNSRPDHLRCENS